jgi:DNA-binding MarR family transcriptional regulator
MNAVDAKASISDLSTHLGYWLRYVSNHVSHAFSAKLQARGVTVAEWVVMRELYAVDSSAPSRLAEQLGMTRGAITKLANRLIAKSLVARKADPGDGRAQTLALTAKGRALVPGLAALADRNDAEFFGHLTAQEHKKLKQLLKGIVDHCGLKFVPLE